MGKLGKKEKKFHPKRGPAATAFYSVKKITAAIQPLLGIVGLAQTKNGTYVPEGRKKKQEDLDKECGQLESPVVSNMAERKRIHWDWVYRWKGVKKESRDCDKHTIKAT